MKCVHCHGEISDESKFCVRCGKQIPRCPTCGKVLTERAVFCTKDGTKIPEEILALIPPAAVGNAPMQGNVAPKKNVTPIILSSVIALMILVGGIIGFSIYRDNQNAYSHSDREDREDRASSRKNRVDTTEDVDYVESYATEVDSATAETTTDAQSNRVDEDTAYEEAAVEEVYVEEPQEEDPVLYFILHADTEYLTEADIITFDAQMCRLARNGIYARMGRKFQDEELQQYFAQYDWYVPYIEPGDFSESLLNDYQIANRDLIVDFETKMGYR